MLLLLLAFAYLKTNQPLSLTLFLCGLIIFISGCDKVGTTWTPRPDIGAAAGDTLLGASIYVDATPSIRGFASAGSGVYETLPDVLRDAATKVASSAVHYYRFGSEADTLSVEAYRQFGVVPSFYGSGPQFQDTRIEAVVKTASPGGLTIILTDLFQDGADATSLANVLDERFLRGGGSVGIVALRVPFQGTVYDVGVRRASFPYQGERPLYVVAIGPAAAVSRFVEGVLGGLEGTDETHAITFGPLAVLKAGTSEGIPLDSTREANETVGFLAGEAKDARLRQFDLLTSSGASVAMTVPYRRGSYGVPFDPGRLVAETVAYRVGKDSIDAGDAGVGVIQQAFRVSSGGGTEGRVPVVLQVNGAGLPDAGLYYVQADIVPAAGSYTWPAWVREWDMDADDGLDGSRTLNLRRLLTQLHERALAVRAPLVARLHYLINVPG